MENRNNKKSPAKDIVMVGLMTALVFIFTYLHIDIPTPLSNTMLHLGNVMSLLAALLFGGIRGGLAAGFGSMIYDMLDPRYLPTCWVTFIMKFMMGWVAGKLAEKNTKEDNPRYAFSAACGSLTYVVLYVIKTYIQNRLILGYEAETVYATMLTKGVTSLANGIIAVVFAVILNAAIRPSLKKAGIIETPADEKNKT
ncbi:MAG: ECF transporter S component [Oscillospiraceae bacterium]|nr:ECF transporter S component [Oscillospiraceae bacterium]MBR4929038.1 ECF transporter S component [Oscillospiraceae bacterium]MBR5045171.1 ECF transporter S component [Oscillospiraceae bacterium]MBR5071738.1 ECF transporter S component [Oscillospiraceae bacterium]